MSSNRLCLVSPRARNESGFTLVEIMVGLVIGLLATLVITQVLATFEGQKRSTMGSSDAQTNGNIALYNIKRDLQMAGFGLPVFDTVNPTFACNPSPLVPFDNDNNPATPPIQVDIFPVAITDGGAAAGASDSIAVRYGQPSKGGVSVSVNGSIVVGASLQVDVPTNMGCQINDIALISNGPACVASVVTGISSVVPPAVPSAKYYITINNVPGGVSGNIACIGSSDQTSGSAWKQSLYAINNGQLQMNGVPSVADIVNIQAQYGISTTANDNQVAQWVNATGIWAAPTVANRNRIKAVRVAVVARNGLMEKTAVTTACSSTTAVAPTGLCAWEGSVASPAPTVDLSNDPNWANYRYRVFETTVPLRNIIWSGNTL